MEDSKCEEIVALCKLGRITAGKRCIKHFVQIKFHRIENLIKFLVQREEDLIKKLICNCLFKFHRKIVNILL